MYEAARVLGTSLGHHTLDLSPSIPIRCRVLGRKVASLLANNLVGGLSVQVFVQMSKKKAHGPQHWGYMFYRQSVVDPTPPLSIPTGFFPAEKPEDNKPYTCNIPSPSSLASLPIYPTQYSFSGLPVVPSPSGTPGQGSPSNPFTDAVWPSCYWSANHASAAVPGSQSPGVGFGISCASATGSSVSRFTSNRDNFSVSQS